MPRLKKAPPEGPTKLRLMIEERYPNINHGRGPYAKGIRYYDLARRLDIWPQRLCEYVQGTYEIPWFDMMALCMFLDCDPDDIV